MNKATLAGLTLAGAGVLGGCSNNPGIVTEAESELVRGDKFEFAQQRGGIGCSSLCRGVLTMVGGLLIYNIVKDGDNNDSGGISVGGSATNGGDA